MTTCGRYRRLRRHPGVTDALPALRLGEPPRVSQHAGMPNALEYGHVRAESRDQCLGVRHRDRIQQLLRRDLCGKEIRVAMPGHADVKAEVVGLRIDLKRRYATSPRG